MNLFTGEKNYYYFTFQTIKMSFTDKEGGANGLRKLANSSNISWILEKGRKERER